MKNTISSLNFLASSSRATTAQELPSPRQFQLRFLMAFGEPAPQVSSISPVFVWELMGLSLPAFPVHLF